jgi:DNA-binding CsgD family transcriptional regulator
MDHIKVLYHFIIFFSCIISFGLGVVIYLKTKNNIIRDYLILLLNITVILFSWIFTKYNVIAGMNSNTPFYEAREIIESMSLNILKWTLPLFVHSFFNVPFAKKANNVFFFLALFFSIYFIIAFFRIDAYFIAYKLSKTYWFISYGIICTVTIYCFIIGIRYYKHLKNPVMKDISRKILILVAADIPLILFDNYTEYARKYIILTPFIILILNALSVYFALKYFFLAPGERTAPLAPDDSFFKKYDISKREKDVCLLLLEGCTYMEIGEKLFISKATVKTHINRIYSKTGVSRREELTSLVVVHTSPLRR